MTINKALFKKEIQVYGNKILVPLWIVTVIYGLLLLGMIGTMIAANKLGITPETTRIVVQDALYTTDAEGRNIDISLISFLLNYVVTVISSLLLLMGISSMSSKALMVNFRDNYEMFHRTIPVSIYRVVGMKLFTIVSINWVIFVTISLLNYLILNLRIYAGFHQIIDWNFFEGFLGVIHSIVPSLIIAPIVVSFIFLANSIFQENSMKYTFGLIGGSHLLIKVFNKMYSLNLSSPLNYFTSVLGIGKIRVSYSDLTMMKSSMMRWENLFSWRTLLHIIIGGVMFFTAVEIYKRREIKV